MTLKALKSIDVKRGAIYTKAIYTQAQLFALLTLVILANTFGQSFGYIFTELKLVEGNITSTKLIFNWGRISDTHRQGNL